MSKRIKKIIIGVLVVLALFATLHLLVAEIILRTVMWVLSPLWRLVHGEWLRPWDDDLTSFWLMEQVWMLMEHWRI